MPSISFPLCRIVITTLLTLLASAPTLSQTVCSGAVNLLPKYGEVPKCQALLDGDTRFLAEADKSFPGDPQKASKYFASRGWQYFREDDFKTAMRRFNQAWLLDPKNGSAIWGMGAVLSNDTRSTQQQHTLALSLFAEASTYLTDDFQFTLAYARALGVSGSAISDSKAIDEALLRFEAINRDHPNSTINLQNWAITLYLQKQYGAAWEKLQLAQKTPEANSLSKEFVEDVRRELKEAK